MRRALLLVVVAWLGAASCGINTEATGAGTQPDAGATGGGGGGGAGGAGGTEGGTTKCFPTPGEKSCGGTHCPLKTDPEYGCAQTSCAPCTVPNATADCAPDGSCGIGSCDSGFSDCDGNAADGCETNTNSDPANCGSCGHDCSAKDPATNWVCQNGQCAVSNCPTGKGDCNNNPADACETDLTSDPKNCKFCGHDCSTTVLHATATCTNSVCGYSQCAAGWADCDGIGTNGCEQDIATDTANCGACGNVCGSSNGQSVCKNGTCSIGCKKGYGDCDGNVKNGCETNLETDVNHCGDCLTVCSKNNDTPTCSSGQCQISCKSGYANCDGLRATGCEASLASPNTCGKCGNDCTTSVAHATAACSGGACSYSGKCAAGWGDCDGNKANGCEASLATMPNCGACGQDCSGVVHASAICSSGTCSYSSCDPGWADCVGGVANGCETAVSADVDNCGSCAYKCVNHVLHASGLTCLNGKCGYGSCNSNWGNCDGNPTNGCETDLTQPATCGGCGNDCTKTVLHVGQVTCSGGGNCGYSGGCSAGFGDCDGKAANGCETPLHTNTDCTACGDDCTKTGKTCQNNNGTWGCN